MVRNLSLMVKRIFDIFASFFGLIIFSPILFIAMLGILIFMPGPLLFRQERIGKDKKKFYILKLRTMKVDKELEDKHDMSKDNERKTKWGNILRRFKIDELLQLVNVLIGDMSLVGPRPTIIEHVKLYTEHEERRLIMRPGMTGLAQINGNSSLLWEDRIEYDLKYIDHFSIGLDLYILLSTVKVVLFGETKYLHRLTNRTKSKF